MARLPHSNNAPQPDLSSLIAQMQRTEAAHEALLTEQRRMLKRSRQQLMGLVALGLLAIYSIATAQSVGALVQPPAISQNTAAESPDREALLRQLGPEELRKVQEFEVQVTWLSRYMRSHQQFDAGAAVALFLSKMTSSVSAVPEMREEMRVMNSHMAAVPAIVGEMREMNAKLSIMTAAMDSTMGRSGRMVPWMPFAP